MRERPVLFARPLVQALLAGRKTQTRRPIVPQPNEVQRSPEGAWRVTTGGRERRCPFGVPGDRLWVREKWGYERQFFDRGAAAEGPIVYAADGRPAASHFVPWKPSLHMPRRACRLLLEVTGVRAERVRQIAERDAHSEGYPADLLEPPLVWFARIWDQYYASRGLGWDADPWAWVVEFRVLGDPAFELEGSPHASSAISLRDELLQRLRDRVLHPPETE